MDTEQKLKADLESAEFQVGVQQEFWRLRQRSDYVVYVELLAPDRKVYLAELDCNGYGAEPIACRFVTPDRHECKKEAWPQGNSTFCGWIKSDPPIFFICWQKDRLALGHHPDWRSMQAWKRDQNQIVAYLCFLQELLWIPERGYTRSAV